ncbi:MAG TPA: CPBP family intramembrane glutamic endopeptidase, partial [Steroidobacteraceae bacterium]
MLVYLILWAVGAVTFGGFNGLAGVGAALAVAIASAVGEEIVFRGVVFRRLEAALGTSVALLISAGVFGLLHAGNAGASWTSTLAIALESGVLLGIAYAATRSLWLPIGRSLRPRGLPRRPHRLAVCLDRPRVVCGARRYVAEPRLADAG